MLLPSFLALLLLTTLLPTATSIRKPLSSLKSKPIMPTNFYVWFRRAMIYFWGHSQFEKMEDSLSKHIIKYGAYYLGVYNLVYFGLFVKKYLDDRQHK